MICVERKNDDNQCDDGMRKEWWYQCDHVWGKNDVEQSMGCRVWNWWRECEKEDEKEDDKGDEKGVRRTDEERRRKEDGGRKNRLATLRGWELTVRLTDREENEEEERAIRREWGERKRKEEEK
jgi:hypothetical protein